MNTKSPDLTVPADLSLILHATGGDHSLVTELIQVFLDNYKAQLIALRNSIGENNCPIVERTAHSLKGEFRVLAAHDASKLAGELERMARHCSLGEALHLCSALELEADRVAQFLSIHKK